MRLRFLPVFGLFTVMLGLSGCGDKGLGFEEANRSAGGVLVERALPEDTWMVMSFSTLDEDQRVRFRTVSEKMTQNPIAFRDSLLSGVDDNLASVDLSYVADIAPALGEDGFRFVMGISKGDDGLAVTQGGVTLEQPDRGRSLLEVMEARGRFLKKTTESRTVYFNAVASETGKNVFYFTLYEDVLLWASDEDELVEMADLLDSEGGVSLLDKPSFREVMDDLPASSLFMLYLDSAAIQAERRTALEAKGSVTEAMPSSVASYLAGQGIALKATAEGLDFRGIAIGDRATIDADDFSFDRLKAGKTYLYRDMPAQDLAVYLESHNFAEALLRQLGGAGLSSLSALGLDPSTLDLSKLFGRGYALALHRNNEILPGLTLMVDVSKGRATATQVLDRLDEQISGLVALLEFQGGTALSGALTREAAQIDGEAFSIVRLNVDKVMRLYAQDGTFVLPDQVRGKDVVLLYGITKDDRLLLSTYEGWLNDPRVMLADDPIYTSTVEVLDEFKEGVVYADFDQLQNFVETFGAFRKALGADAARIHAEEAAALAAIEDDLNAADAALSALDESDASVTADAAGEDVLADGPRIGSEVPEEASPVDWAALLEPFRSFAFSSEASKYKVRLGGVVLMK